jgi:hypothetical protein
MFPPKTVAHIEKSCRIQFLPASGHCQEFSVCDC